MRRFRRLVSLLAESHEQPDTDKTGNRIWRNVDGDLVAREFFDVYKSDRMAWRVRPDLISQYIKGCVRAEELRKWTVVLVSNEQNPPSRQTFGEFSVGLTKRSLISDGETGQRERELREEQRYAIRRVLSPADELIDLSPEQRQAALELTRERFESAPGRRKSVPRHPSGPAIRFQRHPDQALLLIYPIDGSEYADVISGPMIGFFVSFPYSLKGVQAEYAVNPIWQQLQMDGLGEDEEDE